MRAAVLKGKQKLAVEEIPLPPLKEYEVRVKVKYCGICGSDLTRYVVGEHPELILGHEFSGTVQEIGKGVKDWKEGDRVVVHPLPFCRQCFQCQSGATNLCAQAITGLGLQMAGAFAEYCSVSASMLYPLPPKVDFAGGALVEPLAVILHAIRRSRIAIGDSAILFGAGPLGLITVKCLRSMGIHPLIMFEPDPQRARLAGEFGADHVFPGEVDHQLLIERSGKRGGGDVIFECSGTSPAVNLALKFVRPGGTIVSVGVSRVPSEVMLRLAVTKEVNLRGAMAYTTEFQQAIDFLERGVISPKQLVSEIVPLQEIDSAFQRCLGKGKPLKILIEPNAP